MNIRIVSKADNTTLTGCSFQSLIFDFHGDILVVRDSAGAREYARYYMIDGML